MLDELLRLLGGVAGAVGSSREEKFAMSFFLSLMCAVLSGLACLLFLVFAGHGFYTGEYSSAMDNLNVAGKLALVTMVSGYVASRWLREDKHANEDDRNR